MNIINEILQAELRIRDYIFKTPLLKSVYLSNEINGEVYFKLESEQITGSFKARGSMNKVLSLSEEEKAKGCVTASTGNHALGMANALDGVDAKGIIFLPENAVQSKVDALKNYDVELKFHGNDCLATENFAKKYAEDHDMTWVSPYNDPQIIGGQGTIALEITEDLEEVDYLFACIGGGGMMSGISSYFKAVSPKTKIVGCLPERSPEMFLSVQKGEVVELENPQDTLSDGSAGGLEQGSITFDICRETVDEFVLASETEIAENIVWMMDKHHKIIEGAAAVALSAFKKKSNDLEGKKVVIVICGANIPNEKLKELL
jgi:threonine dehydratase